MVPSFKKGHTPNLSEERKYSNTKQAKLGLRVRLGLVYSRHGSNSIQERLSITMCACILHNLLIEHTVPHDWFEDNFVKLDHEDELNQHVEHINADRRCNQVR